MATVRYLVDDVDDAVVFYTTALGFELAEHWGPPFAIVRSADGGLDLWLAGPGSSARRSLPDGEEPGPGGWNRIVVTVDDLEKTLSAVAAAGASVRVAAVQGPGGTQALITDPSGNPIELFQPA